MKNYMIIGCGILILLLNDYLFKQGIYSNIVALCINIISLVITNLLVKKH